MARTKLRSIGDWSRTLGYLAKSITNDEGKTQRILSQYGELGIQALRSATPKDTGITADEWNYNIVKTNNGYTLEFVNPHTTKDGTPIVILLQYGHGTRNGGYVTGRDYINPALRPIFDNIAEMIWNEFS